MLVVVGEVPGDVEQDIARRADRLVRQNLALADDPDGAAGRILFDDE